MAKKKNTTSLLTPHQLSHRKLQ